MTEQHREKSKKETDIPTTKAGILKAVPKVAKAKSMLPGAWAKDLEKRYSKEPIHVDGHSYMPTPAKGISYGHRRTFSQIALAYEKTVSEQLRGSADFDLVRSLVDETDCELVGKDGWLRVNGELVCRAYEYQAALAIRVKVLRFKDMNKLKDPYLYLKYGYFELEPHRLLWYTSDKERGRKLAYLHRNGTINLDDKEQRVVVSHTCGRSMCSELTHLCIETVAASESRGRCIRGLYKVLKDCLETGTSVKEVGYHRDRNCKHIPPCGTANWEFGKSITDEPSERTTDDEQLKVEALERQVDRSFKPLEEPPPSGFDKFLTEKVRELVGMGLVKLFKSLPSEKQERWISPLRYIRGVALGEEKFYPYTPPEGSHFYKNLAPMMLYLAMEDMYSGDVGSSST